MDPVGSSGSGGYATAGGVAGGFNFSDEIHCLVNDSALPLTENGNSFSSLLALPPTEALELLNHADCGGELSVVFKEAQLDQGFLSMNCPSVVFQTNAVGLMDRAARYSVFAGAHGSAEESPDLSSDRSSSGEVFQQISRVKAEAAAESSQPLIRPVQQEGPYGKRKDVPGKTKPKSGAKKSKSSLESADQLPYVHVRARRGQATDSHSLAERARREKINIRMKLLQELVPGCSKISGTALVLDEIIKHVQSLQRQVEFLSMRLTTVNPRIDFSLDSFFSIGDGDGDQGGGPLAVCSSSITTPPDPLLVWSEVNNNCSDAKHQLQQLQLWHVNAPIPEMGIPNSTMPLPWHRDEHRSHGNHVQGHGTLVNHEGTPAISGSIWPSQLKMEL